MQNNKSEVIHAVVYIMQLSSMQLKSVELRLRAERVSNL